MQKVIELTYISSKDNDETLASWVDRPDFIRRFESAGQQAFIDNSITFRSTFESLIELEKSCNKKASWIARVPKSFHF